jgi:hypothetical protein
VRARVCVRACMYIYICSNRNNFNVTFIFVSVISYKSTFPSVTSKSIPWCLVYICRYPAGFLPMPRLTQIFQLFSVLRNGDRFTDSDDKSLCSASALLEVGCGLIVSP